MVISETKMRIVIDNYFESECGVDTSIRQAFEKGFKVGVKKGQSVKPETKRKTGEWIYRSCVWRCSECGENPTKGMGYVQGRSELFEFCPYCGADMREANNE